MNEETKPKTDETKPEVPDVENPPKESEGVQALDPAKHGGNQVSPNPNK